MANVLIPFPGAAVREVEQMVAGPAEQVLAQMADIEHVMSVSRPGLAIITVQFKVGVLRTEALVRLYATIHANSDWPPAHLGVLPPLIKPRGIDDVPILALTLHGKNPQTGAFDLERVAHSIEADLKRVPGTCEVRTIGGPSRQLRVEIDPAQPEHYVWHGVASAEAREYPALTLSVSKKTGQNAVEVASALLRRVDELKNTVIPADVEVVVTRNYGETANHKAMKLIQKLMFATASVVVYARVSAGKAAAPLGRQGWGLSQ